MQGDGSQSFACCGFCGHMNRSFKMNAKRADKAEAAMNGMFTKIIKSSHPIRQKISNVCLGKPRKPIHLLIYLFECKSARRGG